MEQTGKDPLLPALAAGREEAYEALYDRFARRLYRTALGLAGRAEDAEDAVQDVFTAVVRSREKLGDVRDLTAYLFTALRRAVARSATRRARQPIASDEAVRAAPGQDRQDRPNVHADRLERALHSLPPEQQEVIALKIDGELTFAQIARVLGVNANTAASRYRYALEKLRLAMKE